MVLVVEKSIDSSTDPEGQLLDKTTPTNDAGGERGEELHPTVASMAVAFWRMRLLVERRAKTLPLKLLVLSMVSGEEGISPGEIRGRLGLDFSRITRLVQSLEREGLLLRERDAADRRSLHLYPTKEGREYLRERTALVNEELRERLAGLGPAEIEELNRMLGVVAKGVRL